MSNNNLIGQRLKALRMQKSITQDKVADILKVKRQTYSAYERGASVPDAITLKTLATLFYTNTDYLLGASDAELCKTASHIRPNSFKNKEPPTNEFSQEDTELLDYYHRLSQIDKRWIMGQMTDLLKKYECSFNL